MNAGTTRPVFSVTSLKVQIKNGPTVVEMVDLELHRGEIVCLAGESGSGKTTTAHATFGYTDRGLVISGGQITVDGHAMTDPTTIRRIRGRKVGYVPQNPSTALNPSMRIIDIVADTMRGRPSGEGKQKAVLEILGHVGLPQTLDFARRFPHQLSGGQQQRVCIATALAAEPEVLVLDEPTTGLDVVTQKRILARLLELRDTEHVAMLYITHDLAVAAQIADRVVVMYGGYVVEDGPASAVLSRPRHPYTRGLMMSTPDHLVTRTLQVMPGGPVDIAERPPGCPFSPRCDQTVPSCHSMLPNLQGVAPGHTVRCTEYTRTGVVDWSGHDVKESARTTPILLDVVDLTAEHRTRRAGNVVAARGISFSLRQGGCVALVGESGSGKTTIARVVAGLHPTWSGQVLLVGEALARTARHRSREQRRRVQIVFQSPTDALNPKHSVAQALARPMGTLRGMSRSAAAKEMASLLEAVELPARYAERYPYELSGGQRQRVAIARALAADPDVIICDEITSALDVSVQARVLQVLANLRNDRGVSLLFITHDLGVVAAVADEVLVLDQGLICETGSTRSILSNPQQEYTQQLLKSAPSLLEAVGAAAVSSGAGNADGQPRIPELIPTELLSPAGDELSGEELPQ
jgi:peptide/nickel transport system ATP-binding protein